MKVSIIRSTLLCAMCTHSTVAYSATEEALEKKIEALEQRLTEIEESPANQPMRQPVRQTSDNSFNPAISVILEGAYASYKNNPEDYVLPGYALGGEAELASEGFSLGHSELILSSNIDDKFFGQFTLAVAEHDGETELEIEEAFFETLSLGNGFTIRGGRFYSAIGYLNQQHQHAWDFYDAPLVYRGLFGNQYLDDGLRLSYVVPADLYVELGTEVFAGGKYPAGGNHSDVGSWTAFVNFGGDIGVSHSWQSGISYWSADNIERVYGSHDHGGGAEVPQFTGDSQVVGLNAIYKWAPNGNYREQNLKLQFEYFIRDEEGDLVLLNSNPLESSTLNSKQDGWYTQAIWQFARTWSAGLRLDMLDSDNTGSDVAVLDEAGLVAAGHEPRRASIMAQWQPSEYSRIRLQYNRDESYQVSDDQIFVQYTFSMGAHGAHQY
jgi:hypothetical protein